MSDESLCWVRCSCGKGTVLHWPKSGKCHVDDPSWQYHTDPEDEDKTRLWHCGEQGHSQDGLYSPPDAARVMYSLLRLWYLPDGTHETLDSPEEVVERRKAAAAELARLRADLSASTERAEAMRRERAGLAALSIWRGAGPFDWYSKGLTGGPYATPDEAIAAICRFVDRDRDHRSTRDRILAAGLPPADAGVGGEPAPDGRTWDAACNAVLAVLDGGPVENHHPALCVRVANLVRERDALRAEVARLKGEPAPDAGDGDLLAAAEAVLKGRLTLGGGRGRLAGSIVGTAALDALAAVVARRRGERGA